MQEVAFLDAVSQYGALGFHAEGLKQALRKKGVKVHSYSLEGESLRDLLMDAHRNKLSALFTFKKVGSKGKLSSSLKDLFSIPIVRIFPEFSMHYLSEIQDKEQYLACVDYNDAQLLWQRGYKRAFYYPLGVRQVEEKEETRELDLAFFGSCLDQELEKEQREKTFSKEGIQLLDKAEKIFYANPSISHLTLLSSLMGEEKIDLERNSPVLLFMFLEFSLRAKNRIEMLKSITKYPVHVFGQKTGERGWKEYLGEQKNIVLHDSIPYEESIEIMGKSKIVLNSSPHMRYGVHDRVLYALAKGARCLSSEGLWQNYYFGENRGVFSFQEGEKSLDHKVEEILSKRSQGDIKKGKKVVEEKFSWDIWVEQFLPFFKTKGEKDETRPSLCPERI